MDLLGPPLKRWAKFKGLELSIHFELEPSEINAFVGLLTNKLSSILKVLVKTTTP